MWMHFSDLSVASMLGTAGFGAGWCVMEELGLDKNQLLVALAGGVSAFCLVVSVLLIVNEWLKFRQKPRIRKQLEAFYIEGKQIDIELDTPIKSVQGTPRMREWRECVLSVLKASNFSSSDIFSFEHVEASERDSYQWGHKLRIKSLRAILSEDKKEKA